MESAASVYEGEWGKPFCKPTEALAGNSLSSAGPSKEAAKEI
jgi:hypothetical protein